MSEYHSEPYSKCNDEMQYVRITDGCTNQCEYCKCPNKLNYYPEIIGSICKNKVKIMDMNLLCVEFIELDYNGSFLDKLPTRLNDKKVYYEMICGFDYRLMTQETANIIYEMNFGRFNKHNKWKRGIRIAWDYRLDRQDKIKSVIDILCRAGYKPNQIEIFMICDWKISAQECVDKLEKIYEWGCLVNDCWFDNTTAPKFQCNYWTLQECKNFRKLCRMANLLTLFRHKEWVLK